MKHLLIIALISIAFATTAQHRIFYTPESIKNEILENRKDKLETTKITYLKEEIQENGKKLNAAIAVQIEELGIEFLYVFSEPLDHDKSLCIKTIMVINQDNKNVTTYILNNFKESYQKTNRNNWYTVDSGYIILANWEYEDGVDKFKWTIKED